MVKSSSFRKYIEEAGALPADCVLGYIAWFTVSDGAYDADHLAKEFDRLNLNTDLLPAPLRADDAFEKATKEIDRFKYDVIGGNKAEILIREVGRDIKTIRRQMIREVKDQAGRRLMYEKVGDLVFYKGAVKNGTVDQSSAAIRATLEYGLSDSERAILTPVVTAFNEAYQRFVAFHDGQKVRAILRNYLSYLNAVAMKPSVYFVHSTRADELARLKEFADGLGCSLLLLPQADLPSLRKDVIDAFQVEAEKDLALVITEIQKLRATRKRGIKQEAYLKIKGDFDRVMRKATEYGRTLDISQNRTSGAAELAVDALMALQSDIVAGLDRGPTF